MNISDIATEIFQEINQPTDVTTATIIYWLTSNVGTLNLLLDTCFVINTDNSTTPSMTDTEKAIFKLLYERYYYTKQLNSSISIASYGNPGAIVSVTEGTRSIRLASGSEISKSYQSVVAGIGGSLNTLVQAYKMNGNVPLEVLYENRPCFSEYVILPPY